MRVAIVHDDLMQWGGAERVLLAISEMFPEAPIYTLAINHQNKIIAEKFASKKIVTSSLQKLPFLKTFFKPLFFLHPFFIEQWDFSEYDLVISQTTRFAKAIITKPETIHLSYIHTPPRFLWNFSGEKLASWLQPILSILRLYDRVSSNRPDLLIAGSKNTQRRIKKVYGQSSTLLQPFVDLNLHSDIAPFNGGYYLVISRLNNYKRIDMVVKTFNKLGKNLKVVGVGKEYDKLSRLAQSNVQLLGSVSEMSLNSLIAGCQGLVIAAEEDFGLTSLEAQILGKGVIAYGVGGARETVLENKTGVFFQEQTAESLTQAIEDFEKLEINPESCKEWARNFSKGKFKGKLLQIIQEYV